MVINTMMGPCVKYANYDLVISVYKNPKIAYTMYATGKAGMDGREQIGLPYDLVVTQKIKIKFNII